MDVKSSRSQVSLGSPERFVFRLPYDHAVKLINIVLEAASISSKNNQDAAKLFYSSLSNSELANPLKKLAKFVHSGEAAGKPASFRRDAVLQALKYGLNLDEAVVENIFEKLALDITKVKHYDENDYQLVESSESSKSFDSSIYREKHTKLAKKEPSIPEFEYKDDYHDNFINNALKRVHRQLDLTYNPLSLNQSPIDETERRFPLTRRESENLGKLLQLLEQEAHISKIQEQIPLYEPDGTGFKLTRMGLLLLQKSFDYAKSNSKFKPFQMKVLDFYTTRNYGGNRKADDHTKQNRRRVLYDKLIKQEVYYKSQKNKFIGFLVSMVAILGYKLNIKSEEMG